MTLQSLIHSACFILTHPDPRRAILTQENTGTLFDKPLILKEPGSVGLDKYLFAQFHVTHTLPPFQLSFDKLRDEITNLDLLAFYVFIRRSRSLFLECAIIWIATVHEEQ